MNSRWSASLLVALVSVHIALLIGNAIIVEWFPPPYAIIEEFLGWYYALPLAQLGLLAVWHFWGRASLVKWSLLVTPWLPAACLLVLFPLSRGPLARRTVVLLSMYYSLYAVTVHAGFWVITAWNRWRLGRDTSPPGTPPQLLEFGMKQLVLWTMLLTGMFHAGRWFIEHGNPTAPVWPREASLPILLGGHVLLLALAVWAVFVKDSGLLWLALVGLSAMIMTAGEVVLLHQLRVLPLLDEVFVWSLNGWLFAVLLGSLLVVRASGYRLIQTARS